MRNQHRFSALHVRIAGHDSIAGGFGLLDQRTDPDDQGIEGEADLFAHIEAQIGGDLFVAAAAGVELEAE